MSYGLDAMDDQLLVTFEPRGNNRKKWWLWEPEESREWWCKRIEGEAWGWMQRQEGLRPVALRWPEPDPDDDEPARPALWTPRTTIRT
jgi:hypothetical protein